MYSFKRITIYFYFPRLIKSIITIQYNYIILRYLGAGYKQHMVVLGYNN